MANVVESACVYNSRDQPSAPVLLLLCSSAPHLLLPLSALAVHSYERSLESRPPQRGCQGRCGSVETREASL